MMFSALETYLYVYTISARYDVLCTRDLLVCIYYISQLTLVTGYVMGLEGIYLHLARARLASPRMVMWVRAGLIVT